MPKCYQTRVINAPIDNVWEKISNFHDISSWAPNIVETCEKIGKLNGKEIGSKRLLNKAFHETLVSLNQAEYSFSYSIDEGPSPISSMEVKNYLGEVRLLEITQTNETFIEWKSSWEALNSNGEEFCHTIYVALMNDLNNTLEPKL